MKKTGTKSLPALARLALAAGGDAAVGSPECLIPCRGLRLMRTMELTR
jgi:hypothetical protein